ncbi:hypothetical protein [Veillonella magna]|uniref:DUF805 domain-containing protein n=1 Tax=Veillonella magna TaxID=464322 RepID=A0ABS2GIY2_9FIRM|nr:hypothetical protein [Veillonella magna]MBM6825385.1 hypothetical protein [Veillonella magna]MBM6913680.1 hypothetical protein [Veillonella magna]
MGYSGIKGQLRNRVNLFYKYLERKIKHVEGKKFWFYILTFLGLEFYTVQSFMAVTMFLLMVAINLINYRFQWFDDYESKDYFNFWAFEISQIIIWLATNILLIKWYAMIHNPVTLKVVGGLLGCSQLVLWHRKIKYSNSYFKRLIHISFMFLFGAGSEYILYAITDDNFLAVIFSGNPFGFVQSYFSGEKILEFVEFIILCVVNIYFLSLLGMIKEGNKIIK